MTLNVPRPQPLGALPWPAGMLLVPDGPGSAETASAPDSRVREPMRSHPAHGLAMPIVAGAPATEIEEVPSVTRTSLAPARSATSRS